MAQRLLHINDITPDLKSWSVKVIVESKGQPRQSNRSPTRYQHITLVDETGTKILASMFNNDIKQFEKTLCLFDTYIISNAKVNVADPMYDNYGQKYIWVLISKTVVTKLHQDIIPSSIIRPHFHTFSSLVPTDRKITVDLLAIVIKKFQQRVVGGSQKSYVIHEFVLLDQEERPLILSLWNNIATSEGPLLMSTMEQMPIISATKLSVSAHYGVSLGSTPLTTIVVNPLLPETQRLKTWRSNNQPAINEALSKIDRVMKTPQNTILPTTKFCTVVDTARNTDVERFMLKGKLQVSDDDQTFYYMACPNCRAHYAADLDWEVDCRRCNKTTLAKPREIIFVDIIDETGSINATAFGDDAVKVMNMNACMAMEMRKAGNMPSIGTMNAAIKHKLFVIKLRKQMIVKHDGAHAQYTILSLVEDKGKGSDSSPVPTVDLNEDSSGALLIEKPKMMKRLFSLDQDAGDGSSTSNKKMKAIAGEHANEEAEDNWAQMPSSLQI